ncbi:MAG TPA: ABC transporter ATP-binding protein [Pyrinomonadaceae bacterium]|jgi:ABC-type Fe3+/spermidine/putrescine transport system ATPase subunit|nr:ABC transporter ATP-binding protein [Pyrinomonadaceae bacterium]
MALLSLKTLSKRFDKTTAVADVSLAVERGEFFGLLGPSGCGKTTTLRMIAGLEQPDSGAIEFDGNDITNLPAERRGFGMVFQNYALFPHLNVLENVAFGLRARHKTKAEITERVKGALELVQLPGYEKRRVDELSGGQQQRVAIARAIAIEPALLLFDEPLSNLDVTLREETRGELRELVTRLGLTAVYVTHDQEEAFALCDRISVMAGGRLLQTGRPRDLYEHPALLSVGKFLGRNNLLRVMRLSSSKSEVGEFKTLDGGHLIRIPVDGKDLVPLNQPCILAIRPEHVVLTERSEKLENALPAIVREINFAGATSSIKLDANGLVLEALALDATGLAIGDTRTVVLPPERIALLVEK